MLTNHEFHLQTFPGGVSFTAIYAHEDDERPIWVFPIVGRPREHSAFLVVGPHN